MRRLPAGPPGGDLTARSRSRGRVAKTEGGRKRSGAGARRPRKSSPRPVTTFGKRSTAKPSPPAKPGPVNEWFELRQSTIEGWGAFALRDIPRGTRIIEYTGELVTNAEADRRYPDEDTGAPHHTVLFILNKRVCVDATFDGNEARFINHSCDPNCDPDVGRGHIWIESRRRIRAGEELTYDYEYDDDPSYTDKDYRFYGCRCGSPRCRGTIVKTRKFSPQR